MHICPTCTHAFDGPYGQYTLAIITIDPDGLRTVHTLNPNCRDRPVFDWAASRETEC